MANSTISYKSYTHRLPLLFIIVYSYLIIFSSWIFRLFHIPAEIGLSLTQCFDYLPFLYFLMGIPLKNKMTILPNCIGFWIFVFFFLFISIITTLIHGGSLGSTFAHFGALFRYAPLASIIYSFRLNEDEIFIYYKNFKIITIILIVIGYIEIFGGNNVKDIFIPLTRSFNTVVASSNQSDDPYTIFGIFPNTVDYTFFLIISFIILSNTKYTRNRSYIFLIYLLPIYYTGSKAGLIVFIICLIYNFHTSSLVKYLIIGLVLGISGFLIYRYWELFYWIMFIDSKNSRLGYIINTLPSFINEFSIDTFLGTSPDKEIVFKKINSYPDAPMMTWNIEMMPSFEDEFYVALLVYYGVIGFLMISIIYIGMYNKLINSKWKNNRFNYYIIIKSLFSVILISALFNQIIIIKPFSLFFWIWIGIISLQIVPKDIYKDNCNIIRI